MTLLETRSHPGTPGKMDRVMATLNKARTWCTQCWEGSIILSINVNVGKKPMDSKQLTNSESDPSDSAQPSLYLPGPLPKLWRHLMRIPDFHIFTVGQFV